MRIKLSLSYFVAFFFLMFLVHEMHDWAHVLTAREFCGCWSTRAFDSWTPCFGCLVPDRGRGLVPAIMAGPLINYTAMLAGSALMHPDGPPERQSLGFSLVLAALPLTRVLGAISGKGDETMVMRQLFQHPGGDHHYFVAGAALLIVLLLTLAALVRVFFLLPEWWGKLLVLPAFLVIPSLVDHWLVSEELNRLLSRGILARGVMRGAPQAIVVWLAFVLFILLLTRKSLLTFLEYAEFKL